ncbi:hypothetical protein [Photobacterium frigidiphilum]|jgi:hypothetical protein|uniref:hypothetical protein n=1 Tax=Photobacterium frigidiphilum TaxID=264736 RepID=UPI0014741641|nr:hypothetical protein [Photobacterium frigidiphilum]
MTVKHTPTGIVHKGTKGGTTGCRINTKVRSKHWVASTEKVTCDKYGCRNEK